MVIDRDLVELLFLGSSIFFDQSAKLMYAFNWLPIEDMI